MSDEKIIQTDCIRELAQFWDTHDLTDFEDELEEVLEPVFELEAVNSLESQFSQEPFSSLSR